MGGEKGNGGAGGEKNKPPKPKPGKIKIGPQTEADKDLHKVSMCMHKKLSHFVSQTEEDANGTLCDFYGDGNKNKHNAFEGIKDAALLCDDCHAIICKNCNASSGEESDGVL